MTRLRVLALVCACGRNLAGVSRPTYDDGVPRNPDWTRDGLTVTPCPNVQQDDYRPWDVANRAGLMGTPERAAATPGRIENVDFDWHDYTYTWHCRCGRTPSLRHERISDFWAEVKDEPYDRPVWRLVVDG